MQGRIVGSGSNLCFWSKIVRQNCPNTLKMLSFEISKILITTGLTRYQIVNVFGVFIATEIMNQNFTDKLAIANKRDSLIQLMNELDEEKRRIKTIMSKFSNEDAENGGLTGKERQTKLRRMKTRLSFLIEEREATRQKLGKINSNKKH